jgi:predicted peptidase
MDNGTYLTLEMLVGPTESLGSPLNYYNRSNAWIDCEYSITQEKPISTDSLMITGIKAEKLGKQFRLGVDDFSLGSYTYNDAKWGEITLGYAAFKPETAGNRPLIIWLHGGGEGGTDATIPLSANKSVNLASDEIQEIFGGAYVLVPQTPTRWMDDGTGESMHSPGAMYTRSLKYLIDQYVADNPGVDTNRIYLGGCSNGGYMTIDLLLDYPEYFAAAYPVCEGMHDVELTDSDIETLKKTPMWFTTAATDRTLPAPANTVGTYDRLVKAGDERVLLTYYRDIHDLSGKYFDEEGNPYEYNGHWSWIHVYNNENTLIIDGKETTIMEWLADQSL